jgi:2-isopropylmalate synthase
MTIEVKYFHVTTGKSINGKKIVPSSTIDFLVDGKEVVVSATGNGPVDALYNAVNRLKSVNERKPYLRWLEIRSSTDGSDATGEANVTIIDRMGKDNKSFFKGKSKSTDVLEAALLAYISAINQMLYPSTTQEQK